MIALMKKEEIKGFVAVGVNPMRLYPDREFAAEGLEHVDFLVACDLFETETTVLADVVLPICSWTEYAGDYVNLEGRIQTGQRAIKPINDSKPVYQIMAELSKKFDKKLFESDNSCNKEISELLKTESVIPWPKEYREVHCEVATIDSNYPYPLFVGDDPHHSGHWTEKSPSLLNFCSEAYIDLSPELARELDIDQGDSVRVESPTGKIIVPVRISEHMQGNAVLIPRNLSSTPTTSLLMRKKRVDSVKITKLEE
jgi:predicted molibdopterin-dependent oxidoreductase YjgC